MVATQEGVWLVRIRAAPSQRGKRLTIEDVVDRPPPAVRDRRSSHPRNRAALLAVCLGLAVTVLVPVAARAAPCDPPVTNVIACENSKPGNPASEWDIAGAGSSNIEGFATDISVDQGQTVRFKVDTNATNYRIDVYRLGYYGGLGARKVATVEPSAALPQNQPNCVTNDSVGLVRLR